MLFYCLICHFFKNIYIIIINQKPIFYSKNSDDDQDPNEDDEGIGKSPTIPRFSSAKQTSKSAASKRFSFSRSCSVPFGIPIHHHQYGSESAKDLVALKKLPQVTISDFSAVSDFSALNLDVPDSVSKHSAR